MPPLPSYLVSSIFKPSKLIPTFLNLSIRCPSRAAWVRHLVASVGVFVASLSPGGTCDSSDPCRRLSLSQACLTSFSVTALRISFLVSVHVFSFDLVYAVTHPSRSNLVGLATLGWRSLERYSRSPPPPLPFDDLKPPSSCCLCGVAVG